MDANNLVTDTPTAFKIIRYSFFLRHLNLSIQVMTFSNNPIQLAPRQSSERKRQNDKLRNKYFGDDHGSFVIITNKQGVLRLHCRKTPCLFVLCPPMGRERKGKWSWTQRLPLKV
jgi:hypothetical protein